MSDLCKATVLVVDDEPVLRMDLADMLQQDGYTTLEANDAAQPIQKLEQHSAIRVVITDIQMPGSLDGLALSHVVRTLASYSHRCVFRQSATDAIRDADGRLLRCKADWTAAPEQSHGRSGARYFPP